MSEIDWSKAPEGATHYSPGTGEWYRVSTVTTLACVWVGRWSKSAQYEDRATRCIAKPATTTPSWSGEGLPPVGTVLEAIDKEIKGGTWSKMVVLAVGKHGQDDCLMVAEVIEGQSRPGAMVASLYTGWERSFRPIRTPEQIAADEREAAIDAMFARFGGVGGLTRKQCAWVIVEGYRKP